MSFAFHMHFASWGGCPAQHAVPVAPQRNQQQLLCQSQGIQLEEGAQTQQANGLVGLRRTNI